MKYRYFRILVIIIGTYCISMITDSLWDTSHAQASPSNQMLWDEIRIPDYLPAPEGSRISSGFGMRRHPIFKNWRMHTGIDFPLSAGTPVKAAAGGMVVKVVERSGLSGYGKHVVIAHDQVYQSLYAHLSQVLVQEGQLITKGEVIAKSGNTGLSTSPHLHFEILKNGKRTDPREFLP